MNIGSIRIECAEQCAVRRSPEIDQSVRTARDHSISAIVENDGVNAIRILRLLPQDVGTALRVGRPGAAKQREKPEKEKNGFSHVTQTGFTVAMITNLPTEEFHQAPNRFPDQVYGKPADGSQTLAENELGRSQSNIDGLKFKEEQ